MQTFRKLQTASPKNAENIVNNRWPSSILSTACHGSEIKILEPFVVVIVRLVVSVQQHVFVLTGGCVARDCPDIALLETENAFETFSFRRLAVIRLDKVDFTPRGVKFSLPFGVIDVAEHLDGRNLTKGIDNRTEVNL